jgi:peptidoglycan/xylan/chitin deacetylase (PgdA/CDA1 family)
VSDIVSLCYHGVSERWPSPMAVTPAQLRDQITYFLRRGYRPVTLTDAVDAPGDDRLLVVTFDDALASVYRLGLPVLERLGVVASIYAVASHVASGAPMDWPEVRRHLDGEHACELSGMTAAQLVDVDHRGWEVGSHTCSHPWLPTLDDAELAHELGDSRALLEELLGLPCPTLAYPFGAYDERVAAAAERAGYAAAVTLPNRLSAWPRHPSASERLTLPRIGVYRADERLRFRLKVAARVRALRESPAWGLVGAARRATR